MEVGAFCFTQVVIWGSSSHADLACVGISTPTFIHQVEALGGVRSRPRPWRRSRQKLESQLLATLDREPKNETGGPQN